MYKADPPSSWMQTVNRPSSSPWVPVPPAAGPFWSPVLLWSHPCRHPPPHLAPRPLHLLAGKSSLIPASARTPTCTSTLAPGAAPRTRGPPAPGPAPEAGVCIHSGGSRCSHLGQGPFVQSVARQARWPPTVRAPSAHLRLYPFVFPCLFLPKPRWSLPFPTLTSSPKNPIICPVRSQHALPLHPTVSPRPLGSNPPERCSPVTSGDPF